MVGESSALIGVPKGKCSDNGGTLRDVTACDYQPVCVYHDYDEICELRPEEVMMDFYPDNCSSVLVYANWIRAGVNITTPLKDIYIPVQPDMDSYSSTWQHLLHNRPESDPAICIPYSTRSFIHSFVYKI